MIHRILEDVKAAIDETVLREAPASLDEFDEDAANLQTAINDWRSGNEGMPIDQAVESIRKRVEGDRG